MDINPIETSHKYDIGEKVWVSLIHEQNTTCPNCMGNKFLVKDGIKYKCLECHGKGIVKQVITPYRLSVIAGHLKNREYRIYGSNEKILERYIWRELKHDSTKPHDGNIDLRYQQTSGINAISDYIKSIYLNYKVGEKVYVPQTYNKAPKYYATCLLCDGETNYSDGIHKYICCLCHGTGNNKISPVIPVLDIVSSVNISDSLKITYTTNNSTCEYRPEDLHSTQKECTEHIQEKHDRTDYRWLARIGAIYVGEMYKEIIQS